MKRDGEVSTRIVLRLIEFDYNKEQKAKLSAYATDLGIEFEAIEGGGGDPRAVPFIPGPDHYEGVLQTFRSERPHEGVGKVCNLMFGQTPVDADGNVFLAVEFVEWQSFG